MAEKLEVWVVGTGTLVILTLGAILGAHLSGTLGGVISELETPAAAILFGYLWLLTVVAAGHVTVTDLSRADVAGELARAAASGGIVSLVYLTVVLIVELVTPASVLIDPESVAVFSVVAAGTVIGVVAGGLFALFFIICDMIAAAVVSDSIE